MPLAILAVTLLDLGCEGRGCSPLNTENQSLSLEYEAGMPTGSNSRADLDAALDSTEDIQRTTWRWPRELGDQIRHHPTPGPHYRDYFPTVWRQMIGLPEPSDRALARSMHGWHPEPIAEAKAALLEAGVYLGVASQYFADTSTPDLAFPMEGGCCDLVRSRWKPRKGSYVIDGTRARHVQSLRVRNWERDPSRSVVDQVNEFAAEFFDRSPQGVLQLEIEYRFIQINDADGTKAEDPAYGCHDTDWRTYGKHAPHYADYMHWWVRPGEIGFISSTHDGIVHQGFTPIDGERNVHWFGAASQPQQKGPPPDPSLAPALRAARRSGARVR